MKHPNITDGGNNLQKLVIIFGNLSNIIKITKYFKINNNINSKICCKMSKNHDENKDLRLVSRIAKIDYANKTIQAPKSAIIGNNTWGRIDFLCHYCGWTFIWNNSVHVSGRYTTNDTDNIKRKRDAKKAAKENTLTNKKKRKQ